MSQVSSELSVSLRPATPEDLPFIRQMAYRAAFEAYQNEPEAPPPFEEAMEMPWLREYFENWGREGDFGLIAVDETGREVGAAWYRQYEEGSHVMPYELSLAVREEAQGKKVGKTLLKSLLDKARDGPAGQCPKHAGA